VVQMRLKVGGLKKKGTGKLGGDGKNTRGKWGTQKNRRTKIASRPADVAPSAKESRGGEKRGQRGKGALSVTR